ncbi:hypothetical protein QBC36DRAFT_338325 [Triangularia setosa]|uniref:Uncharacterized protein n=1 Tax=Triangularia setosa TaxID=2587417 RepID=A0AAN7A4L7_9PEZI|nr:hypothetical protein QBC36DRAFT_338325 [Podospora setosa]
MFFSNPHYSPQEMDHFLGYNKMDMSRIWYESDARSVNTLNRNLILGAQEQR